MKKLYIELVTTGYNPLKDSIVKIECILDMGNAGVAQFSKQLDPPGDLLKKEIKFLKAKKISEQDVAGFPGSAIVFTEFIEWLGTYIDVDDFHTKAFVCGYNANFHADFLRKWFSDNKAKFYDKYFWSNPLDIMAIASYSWIGLRDQINSFSFVNICRLYGIKTLDEHDPAERVLNLVYLQQALENYIEFKNIE